MPDTPKTRYVALQPTYGTVIAVPLDMLDGVLARAHIIKLDSGFTASGATTTNCVEMVVAGLPMVTIPHGAIESAIARNRMGLTDSAS